jgi:hypothetical protein
MIKSPAIDHSLKWEAERKAVIGEDEANKLLRRPYRKPWVHPDPKSV